MQCDTASQTVPELDIICNSAICNMGSVGEVVFVSDCQSYCVLKF